MIIRSISTRLLKRVLSIYLLVTLAIFMLIGVYSYGVERRNITEGLVQMQRTFEDALAYGLWHLDLEQLSVTTRGMVHLPDITRVEVFDADESLVEDVRSPRHREGDDFLSRTFAHEFELVHRSDDRSVRLGTVRVSSNNQTIFNRLLPGAISIVAAEIIKIALLVLLVLLTVNAILTKPLGRLSRQAANIDPDRIHEDDVFTSQNRGDEIDLLQTALNGLVQKVRAAIAEHDRLNHGLEEMVRERTASLAEVVSDLEAKGYALACEVAAREEKEQALKVANVELEKSLMQLQLAQAHLIETEKMAALGGLVAGVAHEINTPVGLGITAITHIKYLAEEIERSFVAGALTESQFKAFLQDMLDLSHSAHLNLTRTAELVKGFKAVAVDQSHHQVRLFDLVRYTNEVVLTHASVLKQVPARVELRGATELMIRSDPGVWSQILSNLLSNSVRYAFDKGSKDAQIIITVEGDDELVKLTYSDNGKGMPAEVLSRIFDPFFTTGREKGGSGLGMHIVFNLVTQRLGGRIAAESAVGQGVSFTLNVPKTGQDAPPQIEG